MNPTLQLYVFLLLAISIQPTLTQYCSSRPNGCCPGRLDPCSVPFRGSLCYCDNFCQRTNSDCCPDFYSACLGQEPATTKPPQGVCNLNGKQYTEGETTKSNCQTCTCLPDFFGGFTMSCTDSPCLIREDLITRINNGNHGWRASNHSSLWGQTLDDGIIYRLGTLEPAALVSRMIPIKIDYESPLPSEFDAREKWPGMIGGIMDQGNCGASWAFSTTGVASDRYAIQSKGKMDMALSPQHLLSCNSRGQQGCQGGHLDRAWNYIRKYGVVTDQCYPYISGQSKDSQMKKHHCHLPGDATEPCPNATVTSARYNTSPVARISTKEDEIRAEIMMNGPVQASFEVKEDFYSYSSGVYKYSNELSNDPDNQRETGWHSVKILGWGTDYTTGRPIDYWLCANSWGTAWGEDGYFRIVRGQDECFIESFVLSVWADVKDEMM